MKILLIDHAKKHFLEYDSGRWHYLPYYLKKLGHKILHIQKKDWKRFPFAYLKFKPDVIISTGLAGLIPIMFKKLGLVNKPLVHDWNDYYDEIFGRRLGAERASFLEKYVIRKSDFLSTPSKYLQQKAEAYGKKITFIQHGTEINLNVKPARLKGSLKLLYIGEQTRYKRIDRIIEAVRGINCQLYLAGETSKYLKKIAPKNVHFIGRVPHEEIGAYIKAVDVGVITSDQDSVLKLWEYAKAGKPILSYKGRIGYFLSHTHDSYLCEDFVEGIKALQNKKLRNKLAKNIKNLPSLSWKEAAKQYEGFLNKIK